MRHFFKINSSLLQDVEVIQIYWKTLKFHITCSGSQWWKHMLSSVRVCSGYCTDQ